MLSGDSAANSAKGIFDSQVAVILPRTGVLGIPTQPPRGTRARLRLRLPVRMGTFGSFEILAHPPISCHSEGGRPTAESRNPPKQGSNELPTLSYRRGSLDCGALTALPLGHLRSG